MKRDKIIYWISTGLVGAGMLMSAGMYLSRNEELVNGFKTIEMPLYMLGLLGVTKLLGAIALLAPIWIRVKEWAYAGFAFTFAGAIWSHLATGTPWVAPAVFLLVLAVSYLFFQRVYQR
jgi:hypothetical protein